MHQCACRRLWFFLEFQVIFIPQWTQSKDQTLRTESTIFLKMIFVLDEQFLLVSFSILFTKISFCKNIPNSSCLMCLQDIQKPLRMCMHKVQNPLNFTWNIIKFHNRLQARIFIYKIWKATSCCWATLIGSLMSAPS